MAATVRLSRNCLQLLCLLALAGLPPQPATAQAIARELVNRAGHSEAVLRQYRDQLASSDAPTRARAIATLSKLPADSLKAIEARLAGRAGRRVDLEAAGNAMTAIRRAAGSRRADDPVDIAPGVAIVLEDDRSEAVLAVAEPLLLLRSLERLRSRDATLAMAHVIPMDDGLWRHEMRLVRKRGGLSMLAAMIELRSHSDGVVKAWAQYGVHKLGMKTAATALALDDPHMVAQVINAYTQPLDFEAMPAIVRLVASPRIQVREAARATVARFGKNAIWQLREYYEELTGQRANHSWDAERTARELYDVLDRREIEAADTAMARGLGQLAAGDLAGMAASFDEALRRFPAYAQRGKMVAGYAALGASHLKADNLDAAVAAYRRALWLGPSDEERAHCIAQLSFIEAERALTRGVVDLPGYERAVTLQPGHAAAGRARDRLTGAEQKRERDRQRLAAFGALPLLLGIIVMLWRRPREDDEPVSEAQYDQAA